MTKYANLLEFILPLQEHHALTGEKCDDFVAVVHANTIDVDGKFADYQGMLARHDIEFSDVGFHAVENACLDTEAVLTLLLAVVRMARFSEGLLDACLRDGTILRCLMRLNELTQAD